MECPACKGEGIFILTCDCHPWLVAIIECTPCNGVGEVPLVTISLN